MDVKTVLMRDLDKILDDFPTKFVMVKTVNAKQYDIVNDNGSMYNGVIYTYPGNIYIKELLMDVMYGKPVNHYNRFITSAHTILMSYTLDNHVNFGYIKTNDSIADVFVLQEDFFKPSHCNSRLDRRGKCSFIVKANTGEKLFMTRDVNYVPNYEFPSFDYSST